jgi:hypothetical protein
MPDAGTVLDDANLNCRKLTAGKLVDLKLTENFRADRVQKFAMSTIMIAESENMRFM